MVLWGRVGLKGGYGVYGVWVGFVVELSMWGRVGVRRLKKYNARQKSWPFVHKLNKKIYKKVSKV
jgi:hypothetical protein